MITKDVFVKFSDNLGRFLLKFRILVQFQMDFTDFLFGISAELCRDL